MSGLMLNEDSSHFFASRETEKMTVEGLKELVDHYASEQMKEILFNPNSMRTSFQSSVWQPIWKGYEPDGPDNQPFFKGVENADALKICRAWAHNAWLLHRKGIDPYEIWIDYTREKNISPWISMRMNDAHGVFNPDFFMHSDLWKEHPEYRRVAYRKAIRVQDAAFDYSHPEVREYHLKLVREYLERYDMDGIELDWMRFGFHFQPGKEAEGKQILTMFMREVKKLVEQASQRRGKQIKIGVRVPSRPQAARGLGMDAVEWAHEKLVDVIVITPYWATIETDMPVELWKELIDDDNIVLAGGLELLLHPFPEAGWEVYTDAGWIFYNTAETVRGAAASLLYRGVDRIYLFNYMDSQTTMPDRDDYQEVLNQAGELQTACGNSRRHVITYSDTHPPGQPIPKALPAKCSGNKLAAFRIHIGPKPTAGQSQVILGVGKDGNLDTEKLNVWVNGQKCEFAGKANVAVHPVVHKSSVFGTPNGVLNDGYNVIEVLGETAEPYEILWAEIRIEPSL